MGGKKKWNKLKSSLILSIRDCKHQMAEDISFQIECSY